MKLQTNFIKFALISLLFISCTAKLNSPNDQKISEAKKYVAETKDLLMGTLMKKIKENGTENALEFCNLNALNLTKSVGDKYSTKIKRVSDKNRNPMNKANSKEIAIINQYKKQLLEGKELSAVEKNNNLYIPIITNSQCLKCHGLPEKNIDTKTIEKIKSLYPHDLATGYKENELRGLFVVGLQ